MNTFSRFSRIKREFGTWVFVKTLLLLMAAVGVSAIAYFGFESVVPAMIVVVGLVAGWILRDAIVNHFDFLQWVLPGSLFIYGILLFVGERIIGISRTAQAIIIAAVLAIAFSIQFWSLSDPSIVKIPED